MIPIRLSKKSEYACLALVYLSKKYTENTPIKMLDISQQQDIPKKYLEQIMIQLKNAGYVQSIRGIGGGYRLAKEPKDISLAEIVRLIDGPLAPVHSVSEYYYASTPIEKEEKLIAIFKDIRNYIAQKLEETTFQDLI